MKTNRHRTMLNFLFSCLLALLALSFTAVPVAAASRTEPVDLARIDAYVSAEMQANHIPGLALGIVHGNQIVHLGGFGVADPSGRAVTAQTPFIIGSVTKSFTTLAIMQLVESGKVDLDAPVQRYLPWFRIADPAASARITLRNLLNHTSGLPTGTGEAGLVHETLEQFVRGLRTATLTASVGTTFQYCNANYLTLGLIIQTVSRQDYGAYIQQHILTPLQMQRTFTSVPEARQNGLAQGYHWLFGTPVPANDPDLSLPALLPAGLLSSTAEDMSHYLVAQMNDGRYGSTTVLSGTGITSMHAPAVSASLLGPGTSYGLGWFNGPVGGVPALWHDGITGAFHSYMIIEPQNHWGAILLINSFSLVADIAAFPHLEVGLARLLAGQELPAAGLNLSTFYLVIGVILALVSLRLLWSLLRLRHWYRRLVQRPKRRLLRAGWRLFWELVLPVIILLFIPEMLGICAFLLITGIARIVLTVRVLRHKDATTLLEAPPSPSPSPA